MAWLGAQGDPDRRRHLDPVPIDLEGLVAEITRLDRHRGGLVDPAVLVEQDGELVATQSGQELVLREAAGQPSCHLDQQSVPGFVPERVVDLLELVQVDHQERRSRGAAEDRQPAGEPRLEERPVRKPGQRVVLGLVAERLGQPGALGHVLERQPDRIVLERHGTHGEHLVDPEELDERVLQRLADPNHVGEPGQELLAAREEIHDALADRRLEIGVDQRRGGRVGGDDGERSGSVGSSRRRITSAIGIPSMKST